MGVGPDQERRFAFTKSRLQALPVPTSGRDLYHDEKTPGLVVTVTPTGSKSFALYRRIQGRPARLHIGSFPAITVEQARKLAAGLNVAIAAGHDPQETKRTRREEPTLQELWDHWLLYAKAHKKPRSVEEDERLWRLYLSPWSGRQLSRVRREDVTALHARMGRESGLYRANAMIRLLRAMFNRADGLGWGGENPAARIRLFSERSRDRFLSPGELPKFFKAVAEEPNPLLQGFFLLCLLTGARRANVQAMQWTQISWELRQWRIPETKSGLPVVVPLTPLAIEVLEKLRTLVPADCPWVFPGRRDNDHLNAPAYAWKRLCQRAGLEDLRIHDLRRSLASWQALTGSSLLVIGKSLGHVRPETTAIYARLLLDPVRESVERATQAMVAAGGCVQLNGDSGNDARHTESHD